eukprot:6045875-Prymnesium_polylepis.2
MPSNCNWTLGPSVVATAVQGPLGYVGARFGTCFAYLPRYDAEFRGRLLGPRDFSLSLKPVRGHSGGRLSSYKPLWTSSPRGTEYRASIQAG